MSFQWRHFRRCSCVWDMLLIDVVSAPGVVHIILQFTSASFLCHYSCVNAPLGAATTVTEERNGFWVRLDLPSTSRVHGASSFSVRGANVIRGLHYSADGDVDETAIRFGTLCEIGSISYMRADQTHAVPRTPSLVGFADEPSQ